MTRRNVYLDHAAATSVDKAVFAAMEPYFSDNFHNPAATYGAARESRAAIDSAKARLASIMAVKANELILTSGGTEANNLAINGVMSLYPDKKILISSVEHESVLEPARRWENKELTVDSGGELDIERAVKSIDDNVVLVSVMLANNEVGTVQPIRRLALEIDKLREERRERKVSTPLYFHTDAAQAPLHLDIHPHRLGVDLLTLNGGKIYGPKQSGLLYARAGVKLTSILVGGGQQRGMRSGTESPAAAVGLATSLELAHVKRDEESKRLSKLRDYFFVEIENRFPRAVINGSRKRRLANNIHFTLPKTDNERLINQLDQKGIMVAAGSACSAANIEPSHVLKSMSISDESARSSLRLTMGRSTTKKDLDYTLNTLESLLS